MVAAIPYALAGGQGRADALKNLTGLTWDELLARVPGIGGFLAEVQRVLDTYEMASGIFVMAISRFSYRKGERWAWYVLWLVPFALLSVIVNDLSAGQVSTGFIGIPFLILGLLGLLLPYRKFFPRKP